MNTNRGAGISSAITAFSSTPMLCALRVVVAVFLPVRRVGLQCGGGCKPGASSQLLSLSDVLVVMLVVLASLVV